MNEKIVYLIYGTYYETPWDRTLLKIVDSPERAEELAENFKESGQWVDILIETYTVD